MDGAGCGKVIEAAIPTRFSYKTVKVKCGNTSPDGSPYQCEKCEEQNAGRNWRQEAIENGEAWEENDY